MGNVEALMIRAGDFGSDFGSKLIICLVALALASYDAWRHRRFDLLWTLLIGTAIWTGSELLLQRTDTRIMAEPELFGVPIPDWAHLPLQGGSEGGAMAVFALFFVDRLRDREDRRPAMIALGAILGLILVKGAVIGAQTADRLKEITSVRDMLSPLSLAYVGAMVALAVVWFVRAGDEARRRSWGMFGVLLLVSGVFTVSQALEGGRWIADSWQDLRHTPSLPLHLAWFAYDLLAEFGAVVLVFFALPTWLGLIRDHRPAAAIARERRAERRLGRLHPAQV